ncbi:uncharacterized protein CPUR_08725 [Claviceps purpurea 20.1]|uniref:Uncharacterized protein n=1 Tax=Claviceps purpurea (strain 20.1) TaxID=1111077 RepID=M1WIN5_CLAP2|nr:uncharacterized protein CPUR_08725 [Claviceps purpurea 20.1]
MFSRPSFKMNVPSSYGFVASSFDLGDI